MKPPKCVERTCSIFSTRGKFCLIRIFGSYTLFLFRRNNDDVIMRSCIYQGKPSSTRNACRKTRAQIVPKIDWLKSAAKHKVWWATRSWKMCAILEIVHALISASN